MVVVVLQKENENNFEEPHKKAKDEFDVLIFPSSRFGHGHYTSNGIEFSVSVLNQSSTQQNITKVGSDTKIFHPSLPQVWANFKWRFLESTATTVTPISQQLLSEFWPNLKVGFSYQQQQHDQQWQLEQQQDFI